MPLYRWIHSAGEQEGCTYSEAGCTPPAPPPATAAPSASRPTAPSPAAVLFRPPSPPSSPSTPIQLAQKNLHLPTLVIIVACVLAVCFLLLIYYAVLLRVRSSRRRRLHHAANNNDPPAGGGADNGLQEDLISNNTTHHIWYIRTVGLDEATIEKIAVCEYKRGEGLVEGTECSVCLNDFRDGELVRLLPKCSHAFHIPCIDTWLRSHLNCPLCRAPIVAPAAASSCSSSNQPSSSAVIPISSGSASVAENSSLSESNRAVLPEEETEEGEHAVAVVDPAVGLQIDPRESSISPEELAFRVVSDLGSGGGIRLGDQVLVDVELEEGFQLVRRSVSMDWSALRGLLLQRAGSIGSSEEGVKRPDSGNRRKKLEDGAKGLPSRIGTLEMERSLSSGGRFFLSRFSGRSRNVILPL